jgi:5-formyltetrahydrofolate cyclo-ligase
MPKRSIRAQFLAERKSRPSELCAGSSTEIQRQLLQSDLFRAANSLALYSPIHNEVFTEMVAEQALACGKKLVYPRVNDDALEFVEIAGPSDLVRGAFGVLEPRGTNVTPVERLDMVVVPGVVFDLSGHRLGYGRGFYDRALVQCSKECVKVGFAYDSQLVEQLPAVDHDERLSVLMTESRMLTFPPAG